MNEKNNNLMSARINVKDGIYIVLLIVSVISGSLYTKFTTEDHEKRISNLEKYNPGLTEYKLGELTKEVINMHDKIDMIYEIVTAR